MSDPRPERLLTLNELKTIYGIPFSTCHFYRLENAGTFPKRVHLSERRIAFRESEIILWLEQRAAARGVR